MLIMKKETLIRATEHACTCLCVPGEILTRVLSRPRSGPLSVARPSALSAHFSPQPGRVLPAPPVLSYASFSARAGFSSPRLSLARPFIRRRLIKQPGRTSSRKLAQENPPLISQRGSSVQQGANDPCCTGHEISS